MNQVLESQENIIRSLRQCRALLAHPSTVPDFPVAIETLLKDIQDITVRVHRLKQIVKQREDYPSIRQRYSESEEED